MIAASKTNIFIREGGKMENNTFGSRLKALRLSKNLTQEKFANIFYLNKSSISKYEKDKNLPENQLLIKIADFFDVSVDYLLCRTSQQKLLPSNPKPMSGEEFLSSYVFSEEETEAFAAYFSFPDDLKKEVLDYIRFKQQ
ncbi:helix-turn-helix domain-containing protein [Eubacterium sp. AM05-23]|jgi:transcriptional regulator with XRE-family HTH domain|uniref:Transcriptional regulator n=6 Tax=Eubacterium TaxID=1730 RepID=A0AAC9W2V0_EUBLI|nr:helix-turn-helix domain-containing protein [Eubacterium maltosivorans]ARD65531.1 transcriptional regulator [Eubacterium limosum]MBO1701642.1 helix-turn-helix domain-containing protein [Eubacterium callanderi]MSS92916.1 helix-turn-helix domain-containing protein [Eubacterium sp. BL-380-WT-2B]RHO60463.1 helix-turn-helix domain-containing protein [Eubacterium sp. AM05-23]MBS4860462.1 helix-turn-helix domain-containing protein [Eubacterium limosum]